MNAENLKATNIRPEIAAVYSLAPLRSCSSASPCRGERRGVKSFDIRYLKAERPPQGRGRFAAALRTSADCGAKMPALVTIVLVYLLLSLLPARAQDVVVARVDDQPIYEREVQRHLDRILAGRAIDPQARVELRGATVRQLIDRRLILTYLKINNLGASDADLDLALRRVEKQLKTEEVSLEQYLQRTEQSRDDLRQTLAWQIGWQRYLAKYLTDANLQRYFDEHRRDFDGTEIHVAHILFKAGEDPAVLEAAVERATAVAAQLRSGEIRFEEAAAKHSESPSAENGGDIGFIRRHEPQPEPFSKAAFALDQGQVSDPVVTPFGVHLIRCVAIKPGDKTWQQVRTPLERAVTEYLFRWVADQQRAHATIAVSDVEQP